MTTVRRLVTVAAIALIVSLSAVLAVAVPAQAVARLDVPSRVTSSHTVTLSGTVDPFFDAILFVDGRRVAKGDRRVSYAWDPHRHRNGSHKIRLEQRGKVLGAEWHQTSKTLVQAVPPAAPSGVRARLRGARVVVTWSRGSEPDLRGYEISTTLTGRVGSVRAGGACSGRSCSSTLAVPAKAAGRRIGFTVRALRSNGGGGTLASGGSAAASVNVPAARAAGSSRKTGGQGDSGTRSGSGRRDAGDQRGGESGENTGKKGGDERSGVQDLPRLPAKEPAAAPTRPPGTAVVPTKVPGAQENGGDTASSADGRAGKAGGEDGNGRVAGKGAETSPGSGAAGSTGAEAATDTNITTRSSDSPTGEMSWYGLLIAGGLVLLLLGAHGGAWFRRRLPAANGRGGGADAGFAGGDMPHAGAGDGQTRTPTAATTAPFGLFGLFGGARAAGAGGAASTSGAMGRAGAASEGGVPAGVVPRRPAVILAVVKTCPAPKDFSDSRGPIHRPSPQSAQERPDTEWPATDRPLSDGPVTDHPVSGHAPTGRHLSNRPASNRMVPADDVSAEQASARYVAARRAPALDVPVQPISVQPTSIRLAAVRKALARNAEAQGEPPYEGQVRADPARVVPLSGAGEVAPAVARMADRWDDYLPPAPRSMEDSGYWERPQPGATDFWADDRDDDRNDHDDRNNGGGREGRDSLLPSGHRPAAGDS